MQKQIPPIPCASIFCSKLKIQYIYRIICVPMFQHAIQVTWKTRFKWRPFQEKATKIIFIIICRSQPIVTNIYRHQHTGETNPHWYKPYQAPTYSYKSLQTLVPKHQFIKRHQSLSLSTTNDQVTIYSLVHITSSKYDNIQITFTESTCYFCLHQV